MGTGVFDQSGFEQAAHAVAFLGLGAFGVPAAVDRPGEGLVEVAGFECVEAVAAVTRAGESLAFGVAEESGARTDAIAAVDADQDRASGGEALSARATIPWRSRARCFEAAQRPAARPRPAARHRPEAAHRRSRSRPLREAG